MGDLSRDMLAQIESALEIESTTVQRLACFAMTAEIEGHSSIGALFARLNESASCVAQGHLDILRDHVQPMGGGVYSATRSNVGAALSDALAAGSDLYPRLAEAATNEGAADVTSWVKTLIELNRRHAELLEQALDALEAADGRAETNSEHDG